MELFRLDKYRITLITVVEQVFTQHVVHLISVCHLAKLDYENNLSCFFLLTPFMTMKRS